MEAKQEKLYTAEEIKKIAPGYRGKPENFKLGYKPNDSKTKQSKGSKSQVVKTTKPTQLEEAKNPTPQRNQPLWAESVFGVDVSVRELNVNLEFKNSYATLNNVVSEVYTALGTDDKSLQKGMSREMMMYYATSLLWTRLTQIKAQRAHTDLSEQEKDLLRLLADAELNVPQPIYLYLKAIGNVRDKTGKEIFLADHTLPTAVGLNKTGYHAATIKADNHTLFEEIPSLGICGDVLMAQTSATQVTPTFGCLPTGRVANSNLAGYFGTVHTPKEEIKLLLQSFGIDTTTFAENIARTRVNLKLIQYVSDYLQKQTTFRNEKVVMSNQTSDGDSVQFIRTKPTEENVDKSTKWTDKIVRPIATNAESITTFGASYMTGFQLYKEAVDSDHTNWYPLKVTSEHQIPQEWIANRNENRTLPPGFDINRFSSISDSQVNRTNAIVRRMIISLR
ncbi:MAG: hypothetical protein 4 [Bactrocera dorsalis orbivirus isolate Zc]|nr:MAG: hypothetical protein 4 [Bactrocera dorsalis orbivirus isolate Zc]